MALDNESLSMMLLKARESTVSSMKPVLNDYDITEQQWRVIRVLFRFGEINAQKLAQEACILSPSLSRIMARLAADGIILRKVDYLDQRAQNIRLSAKGKRLHNKIQPVIEKQFEELSDAVGKETISDLLGLLQQYSRHPHEERV